MDPMRVFPIDGSTVRITPSSPSQLECALRRDLYLFIGSPLHPAASAGAR